MTKIGICTFVFLGVTAYTYIVNVKVAHRRRSGEAAFLYPQEIRGFPRARVWRVISISTHQVANDPLIFVNGGSTIRPVFERCVEKPCGTVFNSGHTLADMVMDCGYRFILRL